LLCSAEFEQVHSALSYRKNLARVAGFFERLGNVYGFMRWLFG